MIQTYSDGGSRGNPGPSAIGVVIKNEAGEVIKTYGEYIGEGTNNQAEYKALLKALEFALEMGEKEVVSHLDSELVVKQMKREYKVKDADLGQLFLKAHNLATKIGKVRFVHVRRDHNAQADELVNTALDASVKTY